MGTVKNFNKVVEIALQFALKVHQDQTDKAGLPYIFHPITVAYYVRDDQEAFVLALLHDCLEDDDLYGECILDWLVTAAPGVRSALLAISHKEGEPNEDYWRRCRENPLALKVKLADIAHNTSPERLNHLPEETRNRLIEKYSRAKAILLETK